MTSAKEASWSFLTFLFLCYCPIIDARMPNCKGMKDKCQCHPSYTNFKDETNENDRVCLKTFSEKKSRHLASQTCSNEFSTLAYKRLPDEFLEEFKNRGVSLIWIGIDQRLGFHVVDAPEEYVFNKQEQSKLRLKLIENDNFYNKNWCTALNLFPGSNLVHVNCSTELEYVCANFGFPVYPVSKSLACHKDWLFFYHLPVGKLPCIKPFKIDSRDVAASNREATCLDLGGEVADIRDFKDVYDHMNKLDIAGYGWNVNASRCETEHIASALGEHFKENVTCLDDIFICVRNSRKINLKPKVWPDYSDSVRSENIEATSLTCEVSIKSRNFSELQEQLHYVWYEDERPISLDSHVLNLDSYPQPLETPSNSTHARQGSYTCVVQAEGITDHFSSQTMNYFHSDIITFIGFTKVDKIPNGISDANEYARLVTTYLNNTLSNIKGEFPQLFHRFDYNRELTKRGKESIFILIHLYFWTTVFDETKLYLEIKRRIKENPFTHSSIEIEPAAYCFEQAVLSSNPAYDVTLQWNGTPQTKSAVSEPLCLNDWRLITRKCRPSLVWGARWGHVDVSQCTKYQTPVQELNLKCKEGFKYYDTNICLTVYTEKKTFEEAEEICRKQSSFLVNSELLNEGNISPNIGYLTEYWHSYKRGSRDQVNEEWFGNNNSINRKNRTLFCASRTEPSANFLPKKCNSAERNPFICIYHPFLLLNTFTFSKSWYRYSHKRASYYFDNSTKNWQDARKSCSDLSAKSTLLQSVRNLEEYSVFKVLLFQLFQKSKDFSWWMNLFQDGDSLKWLTSPEESPSYVDWERHTDFYMNQSAGVLIGTAAIFWSLMNFSSEHGFVCEMQDLKEFHLTTVYIEDRTVRDDESLASFYEAILKCVPSGWFVRNSIVWFKDGAAIYTEKPQQYMSRFLTSPFEMRKIFEFQGYYSCSVDLDDHAKQVFSSHVLIKFPGYHTFVFHMKSEVPKSSICSDVTSLELPFIQEFNIFLQSIYGPQSQLFLKDVNCSESVLNSYHHFYILDERGTEKEIQRILERSINIGTLFESLRRLNMNKDHIAVKSTVSCPSEVTAYNGHNLTWSETPIGQSTLPEEMCITEEGSALERKCLGDFNVGAHWSPVREDCVNVQSKVTMSLHKLANTNITEDNIFNSTQKMEVLTSEDLSISDVQYVAKILGNAALIPEVEPKVLRSVVETVDTVIDLITTSEKRGALSNVPSKISSAVENIALNTETNDQAVKLAGRNIAVSVLPLAFIPRGAVLENWGSNVTLLLNDSIKDPDERLKQLENFEAAVLLPENMLTEKLSNNGTNLAIIVRHNSQFVHNAKVISPVIDVAMGIGPVYDIDPPVEMVFKVTEMRDRENYWGCVSWDKTLNHQFGGWSYKGCFSLLINFTHVRCQCDHLTSFAVILELHPDFTLPELHSEVLSIVTYAGCSLSIFGLGSIIITFTVFKKWRHDVRHKTLFHLSLSLVSLLLIFLIGIRNTGWACFIISTLLHYFMLASFAWMLVEAYVQYLHLVIVMGWDIPKFLQKAMLFAWGLPVIIVIITWCVKYKLYYAEAKFCWLTGDIFNFAVALPVSTLLATNFVLFGIIFYSVTCGSSKQKLRNNQDGKKDMVVRAKTMFCVSVLLGLSWVFGLLAAVKEAKLVFQYLFVITTTLQGFIISIFFVFRQKKTRDLWKNLVKTTSTINSSQPNNLRSLEKAPDHSGSSSQPNALKTLVKLPNRSGTYKVQEKK